MNMNECDRSYEYMINMLYFRVKAYWFNVNQTHLLKLVVVVALYTQHVCD